jgi:hypothetical protein
MPELVLCGSPAPATPPSALLDSIDAALNSYAAPTLSSLKIDVSGVDRCDVPAHRISLWLRFASQRIAGKLRLRIDLKEDARRYRDMKEELALPICDRATEIHLRFLPEVFLRPPPTGSFSALTDLMISCGQMDGGELGRAVSSPQCPRLRKLYIYVPNLVPVCDVSICSESLECLDYNAMKTGKLEVNAPMLQEISVSHAAEACIIAPKLEMVGWGGGYNPGLHQFAVSGRHLQSLYIMHSSFLGMLISSTQLMKRYDSAKELIVSLGLYQVNLFIYKISQQIQGSTLCSQTREKFTIL